MLYAMIQFTALSGPDAALENLRTLREAQQEIIKAEAVQVQAAREAGWSWQQIADVLQMSKQAAHRKFSRA